MIDTTAIKDRILSLAYQGKLVNIKEDSSSNNSLESVHSHIKGYAPVSEDEFLVDAPAEWQWTRLGYVTSNHGQTTPSDTFSYIDVGTLDNVNHKLSSVENIVEAKNAPSRAKKVVETGDVIYSTVRPYLHNICIIDKDFSYIPIASTAFCVMHANEEVLDKKYLFYWLLTKEFDKYSNGDPSKGALYPAIGEKDLLKGAIPLPAVAEQKAIVEKIETIFEILNKIDALQSQYSSNQEALKGKLVDAAIQGKLTEQLPEDGTAEELIQSIQKEKQTLVKAGKIKREKTLPEISKDEIPFDIPTNWKWVRVNDIGSWSSGATPSRSNPSYYTNGTIPWIKTGELNDGVIVDAEEYITDTAFKESSVRLNPIGSVLIAMYGATIGKVAILDIEATTNQACCACIPIEIDNKYLFYFLKNNKRNFLAASHGGAQPNISKDIITKSLMPLPPVKEQKRIVERLDALLNALK